MILRYHFSASREFDDAVQWYEEQKEGLGIPNSNPILDRGYRRAVVTTYPYGIFYKIKEEIIEVYSISHLHRRPGFWAKRKIGRG